MTDFFNELREERAELESESKSEELAGVREQLRSARNELAAWREQHLPKIEKRGYYGEQEGREEKAFQNAIDVANERVIALQNNQNRAVKRIGEIDAVLNADENLKKARSAWTKGAAELKGLNARAAQLDDIIVSLKDEIDTLLQKQKQDLDAYGDAELNARLAGKTLSPPKAIQGAEVDLSSRRTALASAERALEAVRSSIDALLESSKEARGQIRAALARKAEAAYYDALPPFLPILARLIALNSWIGDRELGNKFSIGCDDDMVRAATAAIEAEIDGVADA